MKRQEFVKAVKMARSEDFQPVDWSECTAFDGCALDNKRRTVTLREVASLLVWNCATFGGAWLHEEEEEVARQSAIPGGDGLSVNQGVAGAQRVYL